MVIICCCQKVSEKNKKNKKVLTYREQSASKDAHVSQWLQITVSRITQGQISMAT